MSHDFSYVLVLYRIACEIHQAPTARDTVVFVEIERDRSLFSYRRHVATFSSALDCNVHAHSSSAKVSGVRAIRDQNPYISSLPLTLLSFLSFFFRQFFLSLFFHSRRTFSYRDRLKFR